MKGERENRRLDPLRHRQAHLPWLLEVRLLVQQVWIVNQRLNLDFAGLSA